MTGPYDWEQDPENSRLRHPAGRTRPVVNVDVEFTAPWWWLVVVAVALVATATAMNFFLLK